jgi:hypothetical protein
MVMRERLGLTGDDVAELALKGAFGPEGAP